VSPITAGVIELFTVPPPHELVRSTTSPIALSNPYTGSFPLTTQSGGKAAFGFHWAVSSAPAGAGLSPRSLVVYDEPFLTVTPYYTLADASIIAGETLSMRVEEGFHLFETVLPTTMQVDILPGWTVALNWMVQP
jgi:hypothetical protein